ncbi:unnamed protein product, partial [marine sediment metagenome]
TKEMHRFIEHCGGKPAAAKQLQVDIVYLNRVIKESNDTGNGYPAGLSERAEISSDGLVSKFRLVFAVPSIAKNFFIKIYSATGGE